VFSGPNLFELDRREHCPATAEAAPPAGAGREPDLGKLIGPMDRERPQPHGIEQLKDGGVGADAQGQRQNSRHREARIPPQGAKPIAHVLAEILKAPKTQLVTVGLRGRVARAEPDPGSTPRLVRQQAGAEVFLGQQLQVLGQLFLDPVHVASPEQRGGQASGESAQDPRPSPP
jgi:hypothetical protein